MTVLDWLTNPYKRGIMIGFDSAWITPFNIGKACRELTILLIKIITGNLFFWTFRHAVTPLLA